MSPLAALSTSQQARFGEEYDPRETAAVTRRGEYNQSGTHNGVRDYRDPDLYNRIANGQFTEAGHVGRRVGDLPSQSHRPPRRFPGCHRKSRSVSRSSTGKLRTMLQRSSIPCRNE